MIYEGEGKIYTNLMPRQPPKKRSYRSMDIPPLIHNRLNEKSSDEYLLDLNGRKCCICQEVDLRQLINNMHTNYDAVQQKLDRILQTLVTLEHDKSSDNKLLIKKPEYLPFKNIEEFTTHSCFTGNELSQLVDYFVYLGGMNIKKRISNMVSACITEELAVQLSLSGGRKIGFHNSQITDAIYAATQRWKIGGKATRESMMMIINRVVRSMKERHRYNNGKLHRDKKRTRLGNLNKKSNKTS